MQGSKLEANGYAPVVTYTTQSNAWFDEQTMLDWIKRSENRFDSEKKDRNCFCIIHIVYT